MFIKALTRGGPTVAEIGLFRLPALALVLVAALNAAPGLAGAQQSGARERAAAAYNRATEAYSTGEYARAAVWYEDANFLVPSQAALLQAVRCNTLAHQELRAATLALEFRRLFPEGAVNDTRIVEEVAQRAVRVDVVCTACELEVDGVPERLSSFFLASDRRHLIAARFATGRSEAQILGTSGERREVRLEPPQPTVPEPAPPAPEPPRVVQPPTPAVHARVQPGGLPPALVVVGAGLALAGGAVTLWSRLDTVSYADAYNADPTKVRYENGRDRERRTYWLLGSTAAVAAGTVVLAIFGTRWHGGDDEEPGPVVGAVVLPQGGAYVTGATRF